MGTADEDAGGTTPLLPIVLVVMLKKKKKKSMRVSTEKQGYNNIKMKAAGNEQQIGEAKP
jgi:hypothetical protein